MKNMDIFKKTMPYVWMRFFLYLLLGIGIVAYYILAFLIIGLTQGFSILSLIILAIGFSIYFAATRYINYLVKAGHVAVISELAEKGTLPAGVKVTQYGKEKVKKRFATATVFYALDGLVSGAVKQIQSVISHVGGWFNSIPAVKTFFNLLNIFVGIVLGYVDEAVLAHIFRKDDESAWKGAADGVVLYFESWKEILKNAVGLVIFIIVFYLIGGIGIYFLVNGLIALLFTTESVLIFIVSIIGACLIVNAFKVSFVDSWITISVVNRYTQVTYNKQPQFDLYGKAKGWSKKFSKICSNAEAEGAVLGAPVAAGAVATTMQSGVQPVQQVPSQVVQQQYVQPQPVMNQVPVQPVVQQASAVPTSQQVNQAVPSQPSYNGFATSVQQQSVMNQVPVQPVVQQVSAVPTSQQVNQTVSSQPSYNGFTTSVQQQSVMSQTPVQPQMGQLVPNAQQQTSIPTPQSPQYPNNIQQ